MAGVCSNKAVAVAVAVVALLALLFAAGEAGETTCDPKVDLKKVIEQCKSCSSGAPSTECCNELRHADFKCLCSKYLGMLEAKPEYAKCVKAIPDTCSLPKAKCPHY